MPSKTAYPKLAWRMVAIMATIMATMIPQTLALIGLLLSLAQQTMAT